MQNSLSHMRIHFERHHQGSKCILRPLKVVLQDQILVFSPLTSKLDPDEYEVCSISDITKSRMLVFHANPFIHITYPSNLKVKILLTLTVYVGLSLTVYVGLSFAPHLKNASLLLHNHRTFFILSNKNLSLF